VDGTLNVLKACARAGTVKRVVQTSSIVAIVCGWDVPPKDGDTVLEPETKWSNPEKSEPYRKFIQFILALP
jgi:dihydroflavonol-4-reductase